MMKRIIVISLCMMLLLALPGCTGDFFGKDNDENSNDETGNQVDDVFSNIAQDLDLPLVWKDASEYIDEVVPFVPTAYSPNVPDYQIAPSLSNVENIKRFSGFTEGQLNQLINNGFLVLDPNTESALYHMKMYDVYETNQYLQIPHYITVDTALHMYHKLFSEALKGIEKQQLYEALQQLTSNMLDKTVKMYNYAATATGDTSNANNSVNKTIEDLEQIMAYFSVANQLINDTYGDIPAKQLAMAQAEIAAIEQASGFAKSPVFGFDVNYEQFIVRGHYAGDEILEKYFKTMMWYGLNGYPFQDDIGNWQYDSIAKSLLITYISYLEVNGANDIELWDKIYAPTNFFVGQSDDLTLFDLQDVIVEVYGADVSPNDFYNEAFYPELDKQLKQLPSPQIQHKLITGAVDTPTGLQFRFMGQRYTLDANILQELMVPIARPIPTGLDVVGAFGNERAHELVKEDYLDMLPAEIYDNTLETMRNKVTSLAISDWQQNLYNGWLWVLDAVWKTPESKTGIPKYMQNPAWEDKRIHSGLGSYAELKHDTVLYAKQPAAERGGGEEIIEFYPNFVEPAVEAYERLLWLAKYSKVNLENRGLLSDATERALNELEKMYELLRAISVKQLENMPLTEEENELLKFIGSQMERIDVSLSVEFNRSISSAIIADVAVIADEESCLEVATGLPNDIYVVAPYEGKLYLARGVTYSYYEFVSDKPLTDQEWRARLGVERTEMNDWAYEQLIPEKLLKGTPPQPTWYNNFKSVEANRVKVSPVEYMIAN